MSKREKEYRTAKPFSRLGKGKEQQEAFNRYFEGLPVKEARVDLRLFPTLADCKMAIPGDPRHCALVMTARRQAGATAVLIFRTVAYVDLPQANGSRAVERFKLGTGEAKKAAELIQAFDKGKKFTFDISGGITLSAPTLSQTLREINRAGKTWRRAILRGTKKTANGVAGARKAQRSRKAVSALGVRDGQGMVHFTPTA